jgi:hypothetical protein
MFFRWFSSKFELIGNFLIAVVHDPGPNFGFYTDCQYKRDTLGPKVAYIVL